MEQSVPSLIRAELKEDSPLQGCGQDAVEKLIVAAKTSSCDELETLIDMAYNKISTGIDISSWSRMFTEASILRALVSLDSCTALDSIARLDRAIIVAGGQGKLDLILHLIKQIQTEYCIPLTPDNSSLGATFHGDFQGLSTAYGDIPVLDEPPSFTAFQTRYCHHPFILRRYAHDWPALSEHPWESVQYLRSVAGPGRIIPVEVGQDYRTDDWSQRLISWDRFLVSLTEPSKDILYLAQHNLFMQFPSLREDVVVPDYVYSCPTSDHISYHPPTNEDQLLLNAWFGPKNTISPAHTDPYFNFYTQIVGRKTVWLAPPDATKNMDPYETEAQMTNTSSLDVFSADEQAHQGFRTHVVPKAISASLEPGDMLFFPPGWWHAMKSTSTSLSVSMWF